MIDNDILETTDPEIARDFETWCRDTRMLGRDRMLPAFAAGWIAGYGTAVDRLAEQHLEDHDR